jgi:hypothetical protein
VIQKNIAVDINNNQNDLTSNPTDLATTFISYLEEQLQILQQQLELTTSPLTNRDDLAIQETASLRSRIFDMNTHLNVIKRLVQLGQSNKVHEKETIIEEPEEVKND